MEPASPGVAVGGADDRAGHWQAKGCVAMLQEALGTIQALAGVQQRVEQMARSKEEAVRQAEAVQVCLNPGHKGQ